MVKRSVVVTSVLVLAMPLLGACSKSCEDRAQDEWEKQQQELIDNGGSNSVGGYMDSLDAYVTEQCG